MKPIWMIPCIIVAVIVGFYTSSQKVDAPKNDFSTLFEGTSKLAYDRSLPVVEKTAALMGTEIQIIILTGNKDLADKAIDEALKEMKRIEVLMTDWNEESEFSSINRLAGIKPAKVNEEIIFLVEEAKRISEITNGKFDISYASAGKFWDFKKKPPEIPNPTIIKEAISKINYRNIVVDREAGTVFLKNKETRIGLGGIAKGYSVDCAIKIIEKKGFKNFAVNAGGDLTVRGKKDGKLWWASIRDPRNKSKNIAILPASNVSIVTSGDYERYFEVEGKRYCHIIDPTTGYPVDHCRSVTVMAKKAYWADALATGIFVLGPEKGMALIESLEGVEGMIVDSNSEITISKKLKEKNSSRPSFK